ncbi:MAG: hypothetical protein RL473_1031 [Actinomycetota bacterium]|jgi:hypothetical protein
MTDNKIKKSLSASTHALRIRWAAIGAAIAVSLGGGVTLFAQAETAPAGSSTFVPVSPVRVLDTRIDFILWDGPFVTGVPHDVKVTGSIPTSSGPQTVMPTGSTGVVLTVTVVNPTADGFVSVRPADAVDAPTTSNINFETRKTVANSITVNLPTSGSDAGTFEVWFDSMGIPGATADILVDITGYYTSTLINEIETAIDNKSDAIAITGSDDEDFGDIQLTNYDQGLYWTGNEWLSLSSDYISNTFLAFNSIDCYGQPYMLDGGLVVDEEGIGKFYEAIFEEESVSLANNVFQSVLEGGSCNEVDPSDFLPGTGPEEDGRFWWWADDEVPADISYFRAGVVSEASPQLNAMWAYLAGGDVFIFAPRSLISAR